MTHRRMDSTGWLARSLSLIFLLLISLQVSAAKIELAPDGWKQLVIPANPNGATVGELFADDFAPIFPNIPDAGLGVGWSLWLYDPLVQNYVDQSLDAVPQAGNAFWIIHVADQSVTVDVPDDLPQAGVSMADGCASDEGCFTIDLPGDEVAVADVFGDRYVMVGSPYPFDTVLTDLRIQSNTAGTACLDGCSLPEAESAQYSVDILWVWDPATLTYQERSSDETPGVDIMPAWQGYWLVAREEGETADTQLNIPYAPQISTLTGRVTTADGMAVADVEVKAEGVGLGDTVLTGADGFFSFNLVADSPYHLTFSSAGHARQVKVVQTAPADGSIDLEFTLLELGTSATFDSAVGGSFTDGKGASVVVQGGSFVSATGAPVTGPIELSITSVDVSNPALLSAFPGDFAGVPTSSITDSAIYSLGATEFTFTSMGERVQLDSAAGATADITIPIYNTLYQDGSTILAGDSIALWSLNEATGIWEQEGNGVVVDSLTSPTGLALSATVTHFTWWNCDVTLDAVTVTIGVEAGKPGTAVISATTSGNLGWRPNTVDTVVRVGDITPPLFVPGDREVCYSAFVNFDDGTQGSTNLDCRTAPTDLIVLSTTIGDLPLMLVSNIQVAGGVRSVTGFPGAPITRMSFSPTTVESAVTYEIISGSLPAGITLQAVGNIRAEIVGVPDIGSAGIYEVTVRGSNGVETNQLDLTISITDDIPAPALPASIDAVINVNFERTSYSFQDQFNPNGPANTGGPALSWQLNGPPLPVGLEFDSLTGTFSIPLPFFEIEMLPAEYWDWAGTVTAINDAGSSTSNVNFSVDCDFCGPFIAE